jgi:hypothetical protein
MGKPSAPAAPDPTAAANAQMAVNHQSMQDWLAGNRVNQVTPGGSLTYSQGPDGTWTQTNSLSPDQEALYTGNLRNASRGQSMEGDAMEKIMQSGVPGSDVDTSGLSRMYGAGDLNNAPLQTGFGDAGQIQGSVSGADSKARQQTIDAVYGQMASRLDPQFATQQAQEVSDLAAKGITRESNPEAYDREMSAFQRAKTDAYQSAENNAITQGGAEQSRLFDLGLQSGNFANSAQNQGFGQLLARAGFGNQAKGQAFGQSATAAQIGNASRAQQLAEMLQKRQEPLNELNMLKGLPTAGSPQYNPYSTSPGQQAPNMGQLYQNQYQGQLNAFNSQQGGMNSLLSSLGPLGMLLMMPKG